jgi:hypothetical protein
MQPRLLAARRERRRQLDGREGAVGAEAQAVGGADPNAVLAVAAEVRDLGRRQAALEAESLQNVLAQPGQPQLVASQVVPSGSWKTLKTAASSMPCSRPKGLQRPAA